MVISRLSTFGLENDSSSTKQERHCKNILVATKCFPSGTPELAGAGAALFPLHPFCRLQSHVLFGCRCDREEKGTLQCWPEVL